MAFRTFVDASGQEWQAYDVVPPADERRRNDRRGDSSVNGEGDERREPRDDRRLTVGRVPRLSVAHPAGWLVFERGTERRRLSPIPSDWPRCSDDALEAYRQSARPVPHTRLGGASGGGVTEKKS